MRGACESKFCIFKNHRDLKINIFSLQNLQIQYLSFTSQNNWPKENLKSEICLNFLCAPLMAKLVFYLVKEICLFFFSQFF